VEQQELMAREAIRDLVARYNANGDSGRFAQVMELFAPDAVMVVDGTTFTGQHEILTMFTGVRDGARTDGAPVVIRHLTATHQIDLIDGSTATGRCYFQVLTAIGLDHWGRYVDRYRVVDGRWRFAHRTVTVDGISPGSVMRGI
jgi:ketosteroid isomerase-like protein